MNDNYKEFSQANNAERKESLAQYLFNPICFIPFGHADDLAIVLMDDFDPVHYLMAETRTTVEEVCLAFCPKLDSFCLQNYGSTFCELHTLLGPKTRLPKKEMEKGLAYRPVVHEFQETTPLLAFTKYKMYGLTTIGPSLLFQQNLLKAMAAKIQGTIELVRDRIAVSASIASLISKDDIDSAKCIFLDLQGSEELGTLIFCRNYSVALALVDALRTLTFGDIFRQDMNGSLKEVLKYCKAHRSVIYLNRKLRKEQLSADVDLLREMHVFQWTHTSLAVSPNAFSDPAHSNCNGFVEALSKFQIAPGHRSAMEEGAGIVSETPPKEGPKVASKDLGDIEYHRFHAGIEDVVLVHGAITAKKPLPLVPLKEVLSTVRQFIHTFGYKRGHKDPGRDVVDMATALIVPVPKISERVFGNEVDLICGKVGGEHFSPLANLLPMVQQRLCYCDEMSEEERKVLGSQSGRLDLSKLKEMPRKYGIPVSLRRTIEYLYQDFAILIADPFLFDAVLDLYDIFATLHTLLTEHLPSALRAEIEPSDGDSLGYLDEGRVEQLSMLVDAIHDALMHRVLKAYPEAPVRDMAIDFRGGLNQILLAADAPVKCGLGLLRKYALGKGKGSPRNIVGGITRISFMPGARCRSFLFGTEDKAQLACFEADVAHVLHVDNYCDNLHESFHLIFNALRHKRGSHSELFKIPPDSVMGDRVSEVFANILCQVFLFGSDVDTFICYHLGSYSKSLASVGWDDSETVMRFTELLLRLFMVVDAVTLGEDPPSWGNVWVQKDGDIGGALKRFKQMVTEFGPFFSEYERLWEGSNRNEVKSYCWKQFEEIYPKVTRFMPEIWSEAM
ncbi:MAG: hypothetical protein NTX52_13480, partial [Planctomycetota bacterium]|nr:hypothetical protein [Planctomycetota bacterium]